MDCNRFEIIVVKVICVTGDEEKEFREHANICMKCRGFVIEAFRKLPKGIQFKHLME